MSTSKERMWRVVRTGNTDLACIVNGHSGCDSTCRDYPCSIEPNEKGHCIACGAIIQLSEDVKLPLAWPDKNKDIYVICPNLNKI